ncbi:MAG: DNA cytosine methyltransferase [Verrucomicrobiota bacterium]|nr:DNA cytosine methyltransferase [Verrucomicrobiota bacterium]
MKTDFLAREPEIFANVKMRTADLFCGGGGSATGLRSHVNLVLGIDNDERALETYRANHGHEALQLDLSHTQDVINLLKKRRVQLICASPPCQDYSNAGLRVEGQRADLTSSLADIVIGIQARGLIMENVPEVLSSFAFAQLESKLLAAGYHMCSFILDASKVGVPQKRRRAFVIATKGSIDSLRKLLQASQDLTNAFTTTPRDVMPKIAKYFVTVPRHSKDPAVVSSNFPAPTLRTNCAGRVNTTSYQPRARDTGPIAQAAQLSIQQLGQLSGFPETYNWPIVRSRAGRIIGNAVCPPVMEWVIQHSLPAINSVRPNGEQEPTHVKADPPHRNGTTLRRAMFLLGLDQDSTPDAATISTLAQSAGIHVFRTVPTLVLRYTYGTNKATDSKVAKITHGYVKRKWTIEICERAISSSCTDDMYWLVPAGGAMRRYRSTNELKKANLLDS